jgi:hypothetical protein
MSGTQFAESVTLMLAVAGPTLTHISARVIHTYTEMRGAKLIMASQGYFGLTPYEQQCSLNPGIQSDLAGT